MASRAEVVAANIIGERGLRYKRNVLAISLIVTVLHVTDAPLGNVSLFGVSLPQDGNAETIAWAIAGSILAYQLGVFLYYGWTDFLLWYFAVTEEIRLPLRRIYFGNPKGGDRDPRLEGGKQFEIHNVTKEPTGWVWDRRSLPDVSRSKGHALHKRERASIVRRLNAFIAFEFVVPALWGGWSLIAAGLNVLPDAPQPSGLYGYH